MNKIRELLHFSGTLTNGFTMLLNTYLLAKAFFPLNLLHLSLIPFSFTMMLLCLDKELE